MKPYDPVKAHAARIERARQEVEAETQNGEYFDSKLIVELVEYIGCLRGERKTMLALLRESQAVYQDHQDGRSTARRIGILLRGMDGEG